MFTYITVACLLAVVHAVPYGYGGYGYSSYGLGAPLITAPIYSAPAISTSTLIKAPAIPIIKAISTPIISAPIAPIITAPILKTVSAPIISPGLSSIGLNRISLYNGGYGLDSLGLGGKLGGYGWGKI